MTMVRIVIYALFKSLEPDWIRDYDTKMKESKTQEILDLMNAKDATLNTKIDAVRKKMTRVHNLPQKKAVNTCDILIDEIRGMEKENRKTKTLMIASMSIKVIMRKLRPLRTFKKKPRKIKMILKRQRLFTQAEQYPNFPFRTSHTSIHKYHNSSRR